MVALNLEASVFQFPMSQYQIWHFNYQRTQLKFTCIPGAILSLTSHDHFIANIQSMVSQTLKTHKIHNVKIQTTCNSC